MRHSKRQLTRKDTLRAVAFRPHVENLEDRWLPGDTVLSALLGQAVLSTASGIVNIRPMGGGNTVAPSTASDAERSAGAASAIALLTGTAPDQRERSSFVTPTRPTPPASAFVDRFAGLTPSADLDAPPRPALSHHPAHPSASTPALTTNPVEGTAGSTAPRQEPMGSTPGPIAAPPAAPADQALLEALAVWPGVAPTAVAPVSAAPANAAPPAPVQPTAAPVAPAQAPVAANPGHSGNQAPPPDGPSGLHEVLRVPTTSAVGVSSQAVLQAGVTYTLIATGNFHYGASSTDWADAQYHNLSAPTPYAPDGVTPIGLAIASRSAAWAGWITAAMPIRPGCWAAASAGTSCRSRWVRLAPMTPSSVAPTWS